MSDNNNDLKLAVKEAIAAGYEKGSGYNSVYTRLPQKFREKLSAPMPTESIKTHPTKTYLSTIKAIFITERLNNIFGVGGWDFEHETVGTFANGIYEGSRKDVKRVGEVDQLVIKGRLYFKEFDLYTPFQYGGGDIDGKGTDPADGFKSAVTDGMGKCASLVEVGIQVFKGNPTSQETNTSRRLDENTTPLTKKPAEKSPDTSAIDADANHDGLRKPKYDPIEKEPPSVAIDPEKEALREQHKELFGKYPSANIGLKKLKEKVEGGKPPVAPAPEKKEDARGEYDPFAGTEPEGKEIPLAAMNDELDKQPAPEFEPLDDSGIDEAEILESESAFDSMKKVFSSYVNAEDLKGEAAAHLFDFEVSGGTKEEIQSLKQYVNDKYQDLSK